MAETVGALLQRAGRRCAAGSADGGLRFLDRREREEWLGWEEILRRATEVAGGLQAAGVRAGDRVGLLFPTSPEFVDAFFGTLLAGGVPAPLYPPVRLGRLDEYNRQTAEMLSAASARLVLADRRVRRLLGEVVEGARPELGCRTLADIDRRPPTPVEVTDRDLALVQFSSGTTVTPKPVALSHLAILAQVVRLNAFWPEDDEVQHSGVSWLPLYHDMGLIGCIFPAAERAGTLTLIGPEVFVSRPATWLRAIARYRATVSPAPNFAYGLCVQKIRDEELDGVDLSCWRVALNGAEAVAPEVLRSFQERFGRWGFRREAMTPVYGLSEASLGVTFSDLRRPFTSRRFDREALAARGEAVVADDGLELVSVGRALPDFTVEIRDAGRSLPDGRVGRVWVQGPSLMDGYLGRPEATAEALQAGWLDTGDQGFLLDGELYLTGRAKDLIILRGRNYAPERIEVATDGLPGARTGCSVAASWLGEGDDGERLVVFVEHIRQASAEEKAALPERVRRAVLEKQGLQVAEVVVLAPGTLPRTSSGKLRRGEAVRRHRAGELAPPSPVSPLRLAGAALRSSLAFGRARKEARGD